VQDLWGRSISFEPIEASLYSAADARGPELLSTCASREEGNHTGTLEDSENLVSSNDCEDN
jgi:hypothetical protein